MNETDGESFYYFDDLKLTDTQLSKNMIICSIISCIGCFSVLITFVIFPPLRRKAYLHAVYCITISDFLSSIGSAIGYAKNGSISCLIEGILTNFFPVASALWSMYSSYVLLQIVFNDKLVEVTNLAHYSIWSISALVTFLPFINVTYGM